MDVFVKDYWDVEILLAVMSMTKWLSGLARTAGEQHLQWTVSWPEEALPSLPAVLGSAGLANAGLQPLGSLNCSKFRLGTE